MNPVPVQTVQIQPGTAVLITCAGCEATPASVYVPQTPPYYGPLTPANVPQVPPYESMSPANIVQSPAYAPENPPYEFVSSLENAVGMSPSNIPISPYSPEYSPLTPLYGSPNSVNSSEMMYGNNGMTSYGTRSPRSSARTRSSKGSKNSKKSKTSKKSKISRKPRRNERR